MLTQVSPQAHGQWVFTYLPKGRLAGNKTMIKHLSLSLDSSQRMKGKF
jgi:hypothetical protein